MIKLLTAIAFVIVIATACSTQPPNRDAAQQPKRDTPIGTILRRHAALRSLEQCGVGASARISRATLLYRQVWRPHGYTNLTPVNTGLIERPDAYPWAALPRTVEATRLLLKKSLVPFNKLLGY